MGARDRPGPHPHPPGLRLPGPRRLGGRDRGRHPPRLGADLPPRPDRPQRRPLRHDDRRPPGRRRTGRRRGPGADQRLPAPVVDGGRARLQPGPQPGLSVPPLVLPARRSPPGRPAGRRLHARRRGPARDPPRGLAGLRHGQPGRRGRATRPVRGRPHRDPRPLAGRRAGHGGQPDLSLQLELEGHGRELDRVLPPPRLAPGHGRVPEPGPDHPHHRDRRAMDLHDRRHRPRRLVPTRAVERPDGAPRTRAT